jgi:hypothetical protein
MTNANELIQVSTLPFEELRIGVPRGVDDVDYDAEVPWGGIPLVIGDIVGEYALEQLEDNFSQTSGHGSERLVIDAQIEDFSTGEGVVQMDRRLAPVVSQIQQLATITALATANGRGGGRNDAHFKHQPSPFAGDLPWHHHVRPNGLTTITQFSWLDRHTTHFVIDEEITRNLQKDPRVQETTFVQEQSIPGQGLDFRGHIWRAPKGAFVQFMPETIHGRPGIPDGEDRKNIFRGTDKPLMGGNVMQAIQDETLHRSNRRRYSR